MADKHFPIVLSFMSTFGGPRSPTTADPEKTTTASTDNLAAGRRPADIDTATPQASAAKLDGAGQQSPGSPAGTPSRARGDSRPPRPMSMIQTYNPPQVEVAQDTPPELAPIFSFLNSHSNKLYLEGYFLKLHDLDARGRPSLERNWVECFAQLTGTVLSLWDATALDVAAADDSVIPTFINLSDASIKMIENLPMSGYQGGNLQNVLSISTAANNRYLLHFNNLASLTQWTAAIRLAMFEHSSLQEAYTGSLIAGKGRYLNNIKQIMFRTQFAHEDWARVRFGAGTPWRRCWCVINPPDEKEYSKAHKLSKKSSAYDRGEKRLPTGDIKFYDTRKVTKKTRPIATVTDAYAAYAIYPQSKPLIDQSTLVKLEGQVTMHMSPESTTEGFVFVMPEVHAAVTGFEMMLRWLFPVYDTFALYGRPTKLIADTLDQRGLMFAMPSNRRYGYLDNLDVSSLIHTKGSHAWSERKWRFEMKKMTASRVSQGIDGPPASRQTSRRNTTSRTSVTPMGVRFGDDENAHSTPGSRSQSPGGPPNGAPLPRTDSAPPSAYSSPHKRSMSEALGYKKYQTETPSRLSYEATRPAEDDLPPPPPAHGGMLAAPSYGPASASTSRTKLERIESGAEVPTMRTLDNQVVPNRAADPMLQPPAPVGAPPAFVHSPNARPGHRPTAAPELRRAHSNVDAATLYQMQEASRRDGTPDSRTPDEETWNGDVQQRQQYTVASQPYTNASLEVPADRSQGIVNRKQRDPRQRLSTIPGSPYVGDDSQTFESPVQMAAPALDGVHEVPPADERGETSSGEDGRPGPPVPLHSSRSIARKPVPKSLPIPPMPSEQAMSDPSSPESPVNDESWAGGLIDEEALERVLNQPDGRSATMTTVSSVPDYASTISNHSAKGPIQSFERPRAGKLKTVGDPGIPAVDPRSGGAGRLDTWEADQAAQSSEIPGVDFGPTYAYKPSSRPGTSGTMTPGDMAYKRRSRSADRLASMMSGALGASPRPSPSEGKRLSYFGSGERTTPSSGRMTPEFGAAGERSSMAWQAGASPGRLTPDFDTAGNRSSMVWQPSTSPGPGQLHRSRTSVTPEEWVHQRAAMAQQQPQYVAPQRKGLPNLFHGRSNSAQGQRNRLTKTPPPGRTLSGDWTQQARRTPTPDRPASRGPSAHLDMGGHNLSAREQMQVSRATGTPLLNLPAKQQHPEQPGMLAYVAARERDKAASREGRNSAAVQQAILERQQGRLRAEADAQAAREADAQQVYQVQVLAHQQRMMMMQAQWQQQQQQQGMQWNQGVVAQNGMVDPGMQQYAGNVTARPGVQQRNSWQAPGAYSPGPQQQWAGQGMGGQGQVYSPGQPTSPGSHGFYTPSQGFTPGGQQQVYQQPYGAAYFGQGGQGQQRRG
ncbi:uncharacterized protein LTR77_003921 [Saxophila tyrrhenica]|uniref:PH domain-containing protein n=1 Tax=Saxophila tyrrhenica TaxID=1690608 RepID=A0AAV9PEZ8_9PEZI|nr:hypothetical protein LTR77_003921 [Saxophila tyrrhenica]